MWIIQSNFIREDQVRPLVEALNELGVPFLDVGIIPFADDFVTPIPKEVEEREFLMPYGSTSLMRIAMQRNWEGLFFDPETFNVMRWNEERIDMLNQDAAVMPLKTAVKILEGLVDVPGDKWFIRPIHDLKAFNGTCDWPMDLLSWLRNVDAEGYNGYRFNAGTNVVLAPEKKIVAEYRFFVVDRKIITGSRYRWMGNKLVTRVTEENFHGVLEQAQRMANLWLPHDTCVMDLADTPDGWKVIEFNCINASGFYYNDIKAFAKALTEYFDKCNYRTEVY